MSTLPWIVGGGVLAWYAWSHRGSPRAQAPTVATLPGHWVWPIARWNGHSPAISDGFGSVRPGGTHRGVDLMFARIAGDGLAPGTANGSTRYVMPDGALALAAADGVVWSAMETPRGFAVVLDHTPNAKASTFYTHLEKLLVKPAARAASGERVRAGQPIGVIGADPLDAEHLKHLHFEVWRGGPKDAIDPAPLLQSWTILAAPSEIARNGRLSFRPLGARGEAYPTWVRALDGASGVYVIRDVRSKEILYVGSSSTRLYATLTRHFQVWRRYKGFWKGQYGEGHDPGLTYDRSSVEVAIHRTSAQAAFDQEMRLIGRLRPRDNLIGNTDATEDAPF